MTINEIKNELEKLIIQEQLSDQNPPKTIEAGDNYFIGREQGFTESLTLLNQLSAPVLVWKKNLLGLYAEALKIDEKRTLTYAIGTDRDNFFVLINGELETLEPLKSEAAAKEFAQTHWNELYLQIINL